MFTSEEPTRFGLSCSGSRAMAGAPPPAGRPAGWLGHADPRRPAGWLAGAPRCRGAGGGAGHGGARQLGRQPAASTTAAALSTAPPRRPAGLLDPAYLDSLRDENGTSYLAAAKKGAVPYCPASHSPTASLPRSPPRLDELAGTRPAASAALSAPIPSLAAPRCAAHPPGAAGYGAASTRAMVAGARRTPADLAAFVELHIEQVGPPACPAASAVQACLPRPLPCCAHGAPLCRPATLRILPTHPPACPVCPHPTQGPSLEEEGKQIGVVTAIAAPAALRVRFSGAPAAAAAGQAGLWGCSPPQHQQSGS